MKHLALLTTLLATAPAMGQSIPAWSPDDMQTMTDHITDGRYGTVTSLLIMRDGVVVYEDYFNGADADTRHDTRSATKTITGMAVGLAIEDGYLSLSTPLAPYFADNAPFADPDPRKGEITPYDLITMTGPLECDDWNEWSRGNEERMYMVEDWAGFFWDLPIRTTRPWEQPAEERPHGRAFSYCTTGVQILGASVAHASNEPLDEYLQRRLFDSMNIPQPEWQRLAGRDAFAGGGLRFRTRDLGQLAELYRNDGVHEGERLIASDWVEMSLREHVIIPDIEGRGYGFLWWRRDFDVAGTIGTAFEMTGNGGNRVSILPELGVVVVVTKTDFNTQGMHDRTDELIQLEIVERVIAAQ